jgi:polyferredoxin
MTTTSARGAAPRRGRRAADAAPGRFRRWRRLAFAAQGAVVLGLPFVRVGGESALRFDVPSLTLHAFGAALQIDELSIVLAATLAAAFAFLLVTVVLGRVWCGWACPQTALAELTRVAGPWRFPLAAGVSALAAANLLAYFVEPSELLRRAASLAPGPVVGGTWAVLAAVLFLDLAFLRYRWCATVCPYAKLQGVMFDRHTLAVAYDRRRDADCISCGACVRACPTGIDIRDGLQSACIACAECADACGPILARLGKRNLVGWFFGEPGTPPRLLRPGVVAAAGITCAAVALLAIAAFGRSALDLVAAPAPAIAARRTPDGRALNAYDVTLTNRGKAPLEVALALSAGGERIELRPAAVALRPGEHRRVRVLAAARLAGGPGSVPAVLTAESPGVRMTRDLTLVSPDPDPAR